MSKYCPVPRAAHVHATAAPSRRVPSTASPTNDLTQRLPVAQAKNATQESLKFRDQHLENDCIQHSILQSLESIDSREQRLEDDRIRNAISQSLESSDSKKQKLENDCHYHQNQHKLENWEQNDICVTEQCDRYYESQGQRIERFSQLSESVIRQSKTNFDGQRLLDTARQTSSALRDIESEANRRQRLNND
ncbi:hypothetical protein EVAR_20692_1 [Eumeta japonica]|uniref:Uncharacterized protein n=1 Tax=Eumeta variegata TaxID=151549 RepID=A0A4C1V9G0_EUMVA|nr:hypothetical protein EVAR_20692_1 [Eumeta japonica]